jgi:predicted ferric reductase
MCVYSIVLFVHGNFCFIRNDNNVCPKPTSWIWLFIPLCYIVAYTIYKFTRYTIVKSVINCGNNIIKLHLDVSDSYNGKTVWICCPAISYLEWHPFSITKDGIIYFKTRGDWTSKFYEVLLNNINVKLLIEGPYYTLPKNMQSIIEKEQTVFISTGVGITSFVNILSELSKRNLYIYKLHIILVVRYEQEIEWLLPLLTTLYKKSNVNMKLYFTGIVPQYMLKYIEIPYIIGRPNFKDILTYNKVKQDSTKIYYSGKTRVGREIQCICRHIKQYKYYDVN